MNIGSATIRALLAAALLAGCQTNPSKPAAQAEASQASPSPTAGSSTASAANATAAKAAYKPIEYANRAKRGVDLIVLPGEIKSNNASFTQKVGPNNIADFAEIELSKANFGVLERSDLGPLLKEMRAAYALGDPRAARKAMSKGKFKTTKWVVRFDVLKVEQVAQASQGFDGRAVGALAGIAAGGGRRGAAIEAVGGSIRTGEATGVWLIGMRFKILDANTTRQVATDYKEEKMEIGAKSTSFLGRTEAQQGGLTLDGMVQRLVQILVAEIDAKHK